ncbi:hypothetical protein SH661x_002374 [Planctomicrobium sp. SH661]|uniref:hypothetical protein n=1 Tax=Planctomicrobium sp. SH661 TaxID=3448124 RepID=UPI003F5C3FC8
MKRQRQFSPDHSKSRQGSLLIVVLVVIVALGFSVYSFSEQSLLHLDASHSISRQLQLRCAASSGIELALSALEQGHPVPTSGTLNRSSDSPARFVLLHAENTPEANWVQGLEDESSLLNINSLPLLPSKRQESIDRLSQLTGMTTTIASYIIEWMADVSPTEELTPDMFHEPPRRRFQRLDQLLLVPGITPEKLYGEDRNGNGIRDMDEPDVNGDGKFQRGLSAEISVRAHETTCQKNGDRKVFINGQKLGEIYDQVSALLGKDVALFIVAARISQIEYPDQDQKNRPSNPEDERLKRLDTARQRLLNQLTDRQNSESDSESIEVRAGLTLPAIPPLRINSLFELAGGVISVTIHGEDQILKSPWPANADGFNEILNRLEPLLTTARTERHEGRIAIRTAPLAVLKTIPGISEQAAHAIRSQQSRWSESDSPLIWIVREGLISPAEFRKASPWITDRGDLFRGVCVSSTPLLNSATAIAFSIERRGNRAELLQATDLPYQPVETFAEFLNAGSVQQ